MPRVSIAVVAVLALLAWWLTGSGAQAPPAHEGDRPSAGERASDERIATGLQDATVDGVSVPGRAAVSTPPADDVDTLAVIRGRCVDEDGLPLANVPVKLRGWPGSSERVARDALERDGVIDWADPDDAITGADGRFEHRFAPPPSYEFRLEPQPTDRVQVYFKWSEIASASVIDVGDIALPLGVVVSGWIVGEDGAPVAGQSIVLFRTGGVVARKPGAPRLWNSSGAHSDGRGAFVVERALPRGRYRVDAGSCDVVEPTDPIDIDRPAAELRVVVRPTVDVDLPEITGVILDERAQPIADARILGAEVRQQDPRTRTDGRFRIWRSPSMAADRLSLRVIADGYEEWVAPDPVAWGTEDLRIVLHDGPPLTIRVRRAADDTPIERFAVVLTPLGPNGERSGSTDILRQPGRHPDGEVTLERVTPGRMLVSVVPAVASGLPPSPDREIDIESGVASVIDVALAALVARTVEVVTANGEPRAGARVELLEPPSAAVVTSETHAISPDRARHFNWDHVAVLHETVRTDAAGRATLHGFGGPSYALRLPGPGHVPLVVQPFRLDDDGVCRIVVGVGATLRGRIEPVELIEAFRPSLLLAGTGARQGESFPPNSVAREVATIAADGSFALFGVPPGEWDVRLELRPRNTTESRGPASVTSRVARSGVILRDGEEFELALDLSAWMPRRVEIETWLDDRPHGGEISLTGIVGRTAGGTDELENRNESIDESGRLALDLSPGSWVARLAVHAEGATAWLASREFVVVDAAQQVPVRLEFHSARLRLRVVDPEGAPVSRLALRLWSVAIGPDLNVAPTDDDGYTTLLGPPGGVRLRARREPLRNDAALQTWLGTQGSEFEAMPRAWIDVGTVQLAPGPAGEQELRLPAEWREMPR